MKDLKVLLSFLSTEYKLSISVIAMSQSNISRNCWYTVWKGRFKAKVTPTVLSLDKFVCSQLSSLEDPPLFRAILEF